MRTLAIAAAAAVLTGSIPAFAQSQISPPGTITAPSRPQLYDTSQFRAPVGHRQPRPIADSKPAEPVVSDPIDDLSREDALLTRRINGICRGC